MSSFSLSFYAPVNTLVLFVAFRVSFKENKSQANAPKEEFQAGESMGRVIHWNISLELYEQESSR